MANSFLYNVLTLDGLALIAKATASNKLIITGTKSCSLAASSIDELAEKTLDWYNGASGSIATVTATDTLARIVVQYTNGATQQVIKSVCITGKIEGDTDSVILAAMSDPDSNIIIPSSNEIAQTIDIPFNLAVTANDSIDVTPGASASIADLSRFVSIHSPTDAEAGDEQTILGIKHFSDGITGCLPYPIASESSYTLDVGAIVLLSLVWSSALASDVTINAGSEIAIGTEGCSDVRIARFSTDSSSESVLDATGLSVGAYRFRALSGCHAVVGAESVIVLGMCTGTLS